MADYSITAVTRRVVYTGSAGVGPYAFTFPVISQTDLAVYKNSTKLTLTTNYTVTINGANGTGSVTLVAAATGADRIVIIGARAIERTTDFVTAGDLKASSLNEQLDASIILIQQLAEENKRTLKAPQFDPAAVEDGGTLSMVLPISTSRAGKTLAFDTDGNPVVGEDIGNWRGNWAAGVSYTVRDLVKDSSNSNVYRVNTAHTSSGTTPISSNADVAKFDLVVDAAAAAASAAAAAASASAAATSASNASTSASNASTSASNASTSASNASSAQTAAESARDATLAAYDNFDDRYLGSKTSNPTLDNDGNALVGGALYFNSVAGEMRIWTGSAWVAAYVSGTGFVAKAGDTMTGVLGLTAGTVSLPALTTTGDTNTGIFFPAADTIAFAEGGVEAMRINSSGEVVLAKGPVLNGSTSGTITISAPAVAGTNTLTLPAVTDTLVGVAATQTLTGKTLTSPTITGAVVSSMASSVLTSRTAVASTSGTSIDFTSIPSWVKRITVMFSGVSTSGTSPIQVQIGAGSFVTSGYLGGAAEIRASTDVLNFTAGFGVSPTPVATNVSHGIMTIINFTGTTWVASYAGGFSDIAYASAGGGSSGSLGGALDRVRITTVNGTDTFDAGTINIMYE